MNEGKKATMDGGKLSTENTAPTDNLTSKNEQGTQPAAQRGNGQRHRRKKSAAGTTASSGEKAAGTTGTGKSKSRRRRKNRSQTGTTKASATAKTAEEEQKTATAASVEPAGNTNKQPAEKPGEPERENSAATIPETPEPAAQALSAETAEPAQTAETAEPAEVAEAAEQAEIPKTEEKADQVAEDSAGEENRAAAMTRTVQLSIQQIMERAAQEETAEEEASPEPGAEPAEIAEEEHEEEPEQGRAAGLTGFVRWLLLVVVLVAAIAIGGIAWLYQKATPDMIPQLSVSFDGQELEATSYEWKVPVVANSITRTYSETISKKSVELEEVVEDASPKITGNLSGYETALTIQNEAGDEVFSGSLKQYSGFTFEENGDYTAKLVVETPKTATGAVGSVTGKQTYRFAFTVAIRPTVRMNTSSIIQGSVVAIQVSGLEEGIVPTMETELPHVGFVPSSTGWVSYLPVAWDQTPGSYSIEVQMGDYAETLGLTVRSNTWNFTDVKTMSQLTKPYLAPEETPQKVLDLLNSYDDTIYWSNSGFVQPFLNNIEILLRYGTTEYVGRTNDERNNGTGNGRTTINTIVTGKRGEELISPADGRVLLAENLGGNAGNTVVVEHGAGVKSLFYNLQSLSVNAGDTVVQGQVLATTKENTIVEVRVGTVPVDPLSVLRGQCDALRCY